MNKNPPSSNAKKNKQQKNKQQKNKQIGAKEKSAIQQLLRFNRTMIKELSYLRNIANSYTQNVTYTTPSIFNISSKSNNFSYTTFLSSGYTCLALINNYTPNSTSAPLPAFCEISVRDTSIQLYLILIGGGGCGGYCSTLYPGGGGGGGGIVYNTIELDGNKTYIQIGNGGYSNASKSLTTNATSSIVGSNTALPGLNGGNASSTAPGLGGSSGGWNYNNISGAATVTYGGGTGGDGGSNNMDGSQGQDGTTIELCFSAPVITVDGVQIYLDIPPPVNVYAGMAGGGGGSLNCNGGNVQYCYGGEGGLGNTGGGGGGGGGGVNSSGVGNNGQNATSTIGGVGGNGKYTYSGGVVNAGMGAGGWGCNAQSNINYSAGSSGMAIIYYKTPN